MPSSTGRLVRILWVLSAAFMVYGGTIPFNFAGDHMTASAGLHRLLESVPWRLDSARRLSVADVVQNILFFVPFGVLGTLARRDQRKTAPATTVLRVTLVGALLSAGIEAIQLFTSDRIASLTDVATNTLGTAFGAILAIVFIKGAVRALQQVASAGLLHPRTFYPMLLFLLVVCISAWEPFDVTLDVGTVAHKIRALQHDVWQFSGLDDEGMGIVYFAVLTATVCSWFDEAGVSALPAGPAALAVGIVTAFGLELSQLLLTSRQPGLEDAVVHALGAAAGVGLWHEARRHGTRRRQLSALAVATASGAAVQMLSPFDVSARYGAIQWMPFLNYYTVTSFNTVSHAIELALIYFPVGFVAGRDATTSRAGLGTALLISLLIAMPIEYAQGWIVGRYADITDVALSAAGALLGGWAATTGAQSFAHLVDTLSSASRRALTSDHSASSNVAT